MLLSLVAAPARAERDTFGLGDGHGGALAVTAADTVINQSTALTASRRRGDTALPVGSDAGFQVGDLVLVLATAGQGVFSTSGDTTAIALENTPVGRWELARVRAAGSNLLTLTAPLSFDYAAPGSQVVRVPEYTDVSVAAGASVVAPPWDGKSGGVLALLANGTVTNSGELSASGAGFRGGPLVNDFGQNYTCQGLDTASPLGGAKGEGLDSTYLVGGVLGGYGNRANGAGGGNCHNAGGGGGGHGGPGGVGGLSFSDDGARPVGGLGGAAVTYSPLTRLLFGGGGGAGHENDQLGSAGGRGGGILFVRAKALLGGGRLSADGAPASDTLDPGDDGAGGGGAGGAVYLRIAGPLACGTLSAVGGQGGSVRSTIEMGPGGGGGGGVVLIQAESVRCPLALGAGHAGVLSSTGDHRGAQPSDPASGTNAGTAAVVTGTFQAPAVPVLLSPAEGAALATSPAALSGTAQPLATVHVFVDGEELGVASAGADGAWSFPLAQTLREGAHSVQLQAEAQAAFSAPSAASTFTLDASAPDTAVLGYPDNPTQKDEASFRFGADEPGATFECSFNPGGSCRAGAQAAFTACDASYTVQGLAVGTNALFVRAKDKAGNVDASPECVEWLYAKAFDVGCGCQAGGASGTGLGALLLGLLRRRARRSAAKA